MITISKPLDFPVTYPLDRLGKKESLLFFDIETTGFSGDYSHIYLIGCTFYRQEQWNLLQWFADTVESEEELLHAFFSLLKQFQILVHFNGDRFDIPFLLKRCAHLGLSYDFSGVVSVDLYQRIKPYQKLLGLNSLKQKSIESFLGVSRTDCCSGGELIAVYEEYLLNRDSHLYRLLLLHNEDDLIGMPSILPILCYPDFLEHPFCLVSQQTCENSDGSIEGIHRLNLVCQSDFQVPVPFETARPPFRCRIENNHLHLFIDLFDGTLKHFYSDYKNYYYLPYEDIAIHKSVGAYVDKDARIKATAETCYIKKEGIFLPQLEPVWEPVMKKERKDKLSYAALSDICLQNPDCFHRYLRQILRYLAKGAT